MKNPEAALLWITEILERHKIRYIISGGFAARIHGVDRELADIDIDISDDDITKVAEEVKPYIIFGPARYIDDNWDLNLLTLNYEGQDIDIAGEDAKIFNQESQEWVIRPKAEVELKEVYGKILPVESKSSLIKYKSILRRDVDLIDIEQLSKL